MSHATPAASHAMRRCWSTAVTSSNGCSRWGSSAGRRMSNWRRASPARIVSPDKIQPVGWRIVAERGAVARVERGGYVVRGPFALADQHEAADHRPHLMMEERPRRGEDV